MTDEQVIKAFECCTKIEEGSKLELCFECPMFEEDVDECTASLFRKVLDLIKRQQAEIERLQEIANPKCRQCVEQTRKNSFVEFADLFKQQMRDCAYAEFDGIKYYLIGEEFVNRRLKELTEVSNGE